MDLSSFSLNNIKYSRMKVRNLQQPPSFSIFLIIPDFLLIVSKVFHFSSLVNIKSYSNASSFPFLDPIQLIKLEPEIMPNQKGKSRTVFFFVFRISDAKFNLNQKFNQMLKFFLRDRSISNI